MGLEQTIKPKIGTNNEPRKNRPISQMKNKPTSFP